MSCHLCDEVVLSFFKDLPQKEVLASLVQKTQTRFPDLNGRLTKATRLALAGDVELHGNGTATVYSSSDPTRRYEIIQGTCTCQDWDRAPEHLCQHRLAAGLVRKAHELLPPVPVDPEAVPEPFPDNDPEEPAVPAPCPAPLPEAPCSCNVYVMISGHKVQVTLRDRDEQRMLGRLRILLKQYPVPQPVPQPSSQGQEGTPRCPTHGALKRSTKGKGWYCPTKLDDDTWCPSKGT
jgi:hypothetical protein